MFVAEDEKSRSLLIDSTGADLIAGRKEVSFMRSTKTLP